MIEERFAKSFIDAAKRAREVAADRPQVGATFVIPVDVFNIQVAVFRTEAQRCDVMRSLGMEIEDVPDAAYATAHMHMGTDGSAWFGMVIKEIATEASWAHECVHIADWIMQHLGIPTDAANTEVRAYLVGHLFAGLKDGFGGAE